MSASESTATPFSADLAERAGVVGVVAHERGHVEGGREPGLAVLGEVAEALVRLLRRAEAGELPHRPEAAAVHRRIDAARERVLAGVAEVAGVIDVDALRASRAARSRCPRSSRRARPSAPAHARRRSRASRRATRPRRGPRSSPSRRIVGAALERTRCLRPGRLDAAVPNGPDRKNEGWVAAAGAPTSDACVHGHFSRSSSAS